MNIVTFDTLKKFIERETRVPLNTDMFWGSHPIFVYPQKMERAHFHLLTNLARTSRRTKPHKKDNGNTLKMDMVPRLVWHLQTVKKFPLGVIKVIP